MARRITGPVAREDEAGPVVEIDVSAIVAPDARSVDALARLTLEARRLGLRLVFVDASPELRDLVAFAGLAAIVRCPRRARQVPGGRPAARASPGECLFSRGAGERRTAERSAGCRGRT